MVEPRRPTIYHIFTGIGRLCIVITTFAHTGLRLRIRDNCLVYMKNYRTDNCIGGVRQLASAASSADSSYPGGDVAVMFPDPVSLTPPISPCNTSLPRIYLSAAAAPVQLCFLQDRKNLQQQQLVKEHQHRICVS